MMSSIKNTLCAKELLYDINIITKTLTLEKSTSWKAIRTNRINRVVDRMAFLTPSTERLTGEKVRMLEERKALSSLASAFICFSYQQQLNLSGSWPNYIVTDTKNQRLSSRVSRNHANFAFVLIITGEFPCVI